MRKSPGFPIVTGDQTMRFRVCFVLLATAFLLQTAIAQESLGDAARRARMQKPAPAPGARVYDNETIPSRGGISSASVSGMSTPANTTETWSAAEGKAASPKPADATTSEEDNKKAADEWKSKIDDQKNEISRLERELTVLQREAQIKAAVFYADAGTQLRDSKKYADDVRQNQADTQSKQQALTDAKQKLSDLEDQSRKAGHPQ